MLPLGAIAAAAGCALRMRDFGVDGDGLGVLAVLLALIPLVRRICGSRVVIEAGVITVVNPLTTYSIPASSARYAATGRDGTLTLFLRGDESVRSVGFAGSIVDGLFGSSAERAAGRVDDCIRSRRKRSQGSGVSTHFTVSPLADLATVAAVGLGIAAVVVGN
ncbi:hypothetical protein [Streptomyces sp. NPDC090025]|uniref:hypothetical protein n=1 Tax=Streptomyces sp. NPDC090025 TaxID=3365922 RepID=UPI003835CDEA